MKTKAPKKKAYKAKRRSYKKRHPTTALWSHNLIIPDRYFVPLELEVMAKIPQSSPASGFFWVTANTIMDPFGQYQAIVNDYSLSSGSTVGGTCNFTMTGGSSKANDLKGYAELITLYNRCKVNHATLTIGMNLSASSDSMQVAVVPFAYSQYLNFIGTKAMSYLTSAPYSTERIFTNNDTNSKGDVLVNKMSSRKILGLNRYQYGAKTAPVVTGTVLTGQPAINDAWGFFVQYNTLNDSTISSAGIDSIVLKLKCLCEFSERIQSGTA